MNPITISDQQRMIQDSADKFLQSEYDFLKRHQIIEKHKGFSTFIWEQFAELGWLEMSIDSTFNGHEDGFNLFDVALLMEKFGQALVVEPYVSQVLFAGSLIANSGNQHWSDLLLPTLAQGKLNVSIACSESASAYQTTAIECIAKPGIGGYVLQGHKSVVLGADRAHYFITSAKMGEAADAPIGFFMLESQSDGITMRPYPTIDGGYAAEVFLNQVKLRETDLLMRDRHGLDVFHLVQSLAMIALMAQGVGAIEGAVNTTAQYLNDREQFDRKLSSFQALRHEVADMYVLKEEAKALVRLAAHQFESSTPQERDLLVYGAKAYLGEFGRQVCEAAVQLNGAIAITDEYIVGHYLKKIIAVDRSMSDVLNSLDVYMQCSPHLQANQS